MSDKKTDPELSPAEMKADLERRQKDHKFMTSEEVSAWNAARGLRPQSEKHWMSKQREADRIEKLRTDRQQRMRFLASGWKRLAKNKSNELCGLLGGIVTY